MANNTNTNVSNPSRIQAGLSTLIEIKVGEEKVGAIQSLGYSETRTIERVQEVGTDGVIEIVPVSGTFYELTAERLVFERLRLPEAFARGFQHIQSQAVPFNIHITHFNNYPISPSADADDPNKHRYMVYLNCWFQAYGGTYRAGAYLVTETSTIWAERAKTNNPALAENMMNGHKIEARDALTYEQDISNLADLGALDEAGAPLWFPAPIA